jgi:hypothetical protein
MDEEAEKFDPLNDPQNLTGKYILDDDGNVVPCCNLMEWAEWFEASYKNGKRRHPCEHCVPGPGPLLWRWASAGVRDHDLWR